MAAIVTAALCVPAASHADQPAAPRSQTDPAHAITQPWFRVFLTDGQVVSALGEFARVESAVVLHVPVGPIRDGRAETRAVTIPASVVDWPRTEAYREAVRRAQFAQVGGERAYAAFTEEVAATLR